MTGIRIDMTSDASEPERDLDRVNSKLKQLGKSATAAARQTEKGSQAAIGSYARLKAELKQNQRVLEHLKVGSAEFTQQKAKVDKLARGVRAAKKETQALGGSAGDMSGGFMEATKNAVGIAGAVGIASSAVGALISKVESEFAQIERRQEEAFLSNASFEEVVTKNAGNFGESRSEVSARAMRISREDNIDPRLVVDALATLNSQTSAVANPDQQEAAFRQTLAVTRDVEKSVSVATAALRRAAEDSPDGSIRLDDIKSQIGATLALQSQLVTTNIDTFLNNMESASKAGTRDRRELNAMGSEAVRELGILLSGEVGDKEGAETGNFLGKAFDILGDLKLQEKTKLNDGTVLSTTKEAIQAVREEKNIFAKIELIQNDKSIAAQIYKQLPRADAKGTFGALLSGDARLSNRLDEIRKEYAEGDAARERLAIEQAETARTSGALIAQQGAEALAVRSKSVNVTEGLQGQLKGIIKSVTANLPDGLMDDESVDELYDGVIPNLGAGASEETKALTALRVMERSAERTPQQKTAFADARRLIRMTSKTHDEAQANQILSPAESAYGVMQNTLGSIHDLPGIDSLQREVAEKVFDREIDKGTAPHQAATLALERAGRPSTRFDGELSERDQNILQQGINKLAEQQAAMQEEQRRHNEEMKALAERQTAAAEKALVENKPPDVVKVQSVNSGPTPSPPAAQGVP